MNATVVSFSSSILKSAIVFTPSTTDIGAYSPPQSVFTQPVWAEFTLIGVFFNASAKYIENWFN